MICYFYCSFDDLSTQDPCNIVGSFAAQLSEKVPSILDDFRDTFVNEQSEARKRNPTLADLTDMLVKAITSLEKIYFFVDAVNESEKSAEGLEFAIKIAEHCKHSRIILSSTRSWNHAAREKKIRFFEVEMRAEDVDKDVSSFIEMELHLHPVLSKFSSQLKADIKQTLLSQSDGM